MTAAEKLRQRFESRAAKEETVDDDWREPVGAEADAPRDPAADSWLAALATAREDIARLLAGGEGKTREPLFGTDAVELLAREFDGPRWLVTGLVTRGGIAVIGAEPKTAKTWIALELAIAVATGSKVFGEFDAERGRAAYFFAEDVDVQVQTRVRALLAGADRKLEAGQLHVQPRGSFIDVTNDDDLAWIVASCRQRGSLRVLVLDPLRDIHSGEENESDSMRDVMRRLRVLTEILCCTVVAVHHAPKANKDTSKRRPGQNLRGSSAIHGSIDSGIYLENADSDGTNVFTSTVTSQIKGARSAGTFELRLTVTDDAHGAAICAQWRHSRLEFKRSKKAGQADADDDKMLAFVRMLATRGETLSKTALRSHDENPVAEKRATAAIDRLLEAGQIRLHLGRIEPRETTPDRSSPND